MLSESERQVLARLEADLCREDPLLAVALLRMCPPQPGRWARTVYATVVALGLIVTLVCLALFADGTGGGVPGSPSVSPRTTSSAERLSGCAG